MVLHFLILHKIFETKVRETKVISRDDGTGTGTATGTAGPGPGRMYEEPFMCDVVPEAIEMIVSNTAIVQPQAQ